MWGGAFVMVPVRVSRGTNEMMQSLSNATCTPSLWCRPRVLCVCVSARRQWLGFMIALRGVVRCGETPPHQKRLSIRNASHQKRLLPERRRLPAVPPQPQHGRGSSLILHCHFPCALPTFERAERFSSSATGRFSCSMINEPADLDGRGTVLSGGAGTQGGGANAMGSE